MKISQVDITNTDKPLDAEFTYSVTWQPDDTPFEERMDRLAGGGGLLPESFEVCLLFG